MAVVMTVVLIHLKKKFKISLQVLMLKKTFNIQVRGPILHLGNGRDNTFATNVSV